MRVFYTSIIVVILDQITKLLVKGFSVPFLNIKYKGMDYAESFNVIGDFFKITFVENPGMAFGLDFGPVSKFFLSTFSIVASIGLIYFIYKSKHEKFMFRFSLALILGGAVGNLIDRVFYGVFYDYAPLMYGKVVDFLNVDFFDFTILGRTYDRWPIFNIADAAVSVGVVILILFNGNKPLFNREKHNEDEIAEGSKEGIESFENEEKILNGEDNNRKDI